MHTDHTSQLQCVVNSRRQSQPMEAPLKCMSLLPRLAIFYAVMPPMCWDWFISFEAQRTFPTEKPTKSAANIHACAQVDPIGKLKNYQVKLHIDNSVKPVAQGHRRVPFHLRKKVEQELEKLETQDIIERVDGPTPWISPIVTPPKPNDPNSIRLCVDMREANKAVMRERHLTPTIDNIIHDLNGNTIFSKLDLRSGYHQLELHPDSRYITTFSTHAGLWRYKRLNFGISSASEVFQNTIQTVLQGIPGVCNISDYLCSVNRKTITRR